jgi:SAM-dependent methyltransferase
MPEVFGPGYAGAYDALYEEKDYEGECDLLERIFGDYGDGPVGTILDLGCGTGNHALPLARRGYEVVGVDRSEAMLDRARTKAAGAVSFALGDIRDVRLGREFDAVLVLFAVLGYQLSNDDVLAALATARAHLRPGGLLVFDVWYGPAVLHERPAPRSRTIEQGDVRLLRDSSGSLDTSRHLCTVEMRIRQLEGERLVAQSEERHEMRYFFPLELQLFLATAGFSLLRLGAFPDIDRDPDETTWNVLGVAGRGERLVPRPDERGPADP